MQESRNILDLTRGEKAVIKDIRGDDSLVMPLLKQGLTPGTQIEKKSSGSFGDPTAYAMRGTTIALRKEEAECLLL